MSTIFTLVSRKRLNKHWDSVTLLYPKIAECARPENQERLMCKLFLVLMNDIPFREATESANTEKFIEVTVSDVTLVGATRRVKMANFVGSSGKFLCQWVSRRQEVVDLHRDQ